MLFVIYVLCKVAVVRSFFRVVSVFIKTRPQFFGGFPNVYDVAYLASCGIQYVACLAVTTGCDFDWLSGGTVDYSVILAY